MKKLTRLICALLASVMILSIVACTKPGEGSDTTEKDSSVQDESRDLDPNQSADPSDSSSDNQSDTEPIPVETNEYDAMGIEKDKKFNENYLIYNWKDQIQWEFVKKDEYDPADVIKASIYRRQSIVEEKLGVTITTELEPGSWGDRNSFIARLKASVDNNEHAYDLVGQYTCAASIGAMYGLYKPLNKTKYFNSDHEWWPGDIVDSASVNRNLYFVTGDITPTLIRSMGCLIVNQNMANDKGLPNLYELVNSKKWTFEKLTELVVGANAQGNVDGTETYSLTLPNNVAYDNLFYAGGFRYIDSDPVSGALEVSKTLAGQPMVDWFDACRRLLNDNKDVEFVAINAANGFVNGNSLMYLGSLADIQNYSKDMKFKFTILPVPMRDEKQEDYNTIVGMWVTYYSIPVDAKNTELSSAVLEALGYYGKTNLTKTFCNEVFPLRLLESEENAKIFDLLRNTLTYDTGRFFADQVNMFALFRKASSNSDTWTTLYTQRKLWNTSIDKIVKELG